MISLRTKSAPSRSSLRSIGRPTMEGYWCSGKFWRCQDEVVVHVGGSWAYLSGISDFEEASTSIEDCEMVSEMPCTDAPCSYQWVPQPFCRCLTGYVPLRSPHATMSRKVVRGEVKKGKKNSQRSVYHNVIQGVLGHGVGIGASGMVHVYLVPAVVVTSLLLTLNCVSTLSSG
jgi:hypothetical protein